LAEAIEHFSEKELLKIFSEVKRVLKPNGIMLVTTPNRHRLGNFLGSWKQNKNKANGPGWGHEKEYTIRELKKYIDQAGFKAEIAKQDNFYSNIGKSAKDTYFYPLLSFVNYKNKIYNLGKMLSVPITFVFSFLRDSIIILAKKQK
jgi:predicted SAM-dependent methyltransferase